MLLFLDTEFADAEGNELVSLALVSEDGKRDFYAERDPLPRNATAFVHKYVYPLLNRGDAAMDDGTFTAQLRAFLRRFPAVHVIYDFPDDWRLLGHAVNGFSLSRSVANPLDPLPEMVAMLTQRSDVMRYTEEWFAQHPQFRRHHALVDAHALRAGWLKAHR